MNGELPPGDLGGADADRGYGHRGERPMSMRSLLSRSTTDSRLIFEGTASNPGVQSEEEAAAALFWEEEENKRFQEDDPHEFKMWNFRISGIGNLLVYIFLGLGCLAFLIIHLATDPEDARLDKVARARARSLSLSLSFSLSILIIHPRAKTMFPPRPIQTG
ncbi:hypothetical protein T484DRAFT_1896242, partial [Baffinella frigidus]